jgi:hypothetical protein
MRPQQLFTALSFIFCGLVLQKPAELSQNSPLSGFSSAWNDARFLKCNTAANTAYLSKEEKDIIYILNMARTDPALFANTVVEKYPEFRNKPSLKDLPDFKTLLDTLRLVRTLPLLYPDSTCFESAKCHAISAGSLGYVGHERKTDQCKSNRHHQGECCQYGYKDPLLILMALFIDQNVPSHGHRFLCLSAYKKIGVSIQPHTAYGYNTVIDFYF